MTQVEVQINARNYRITCDDGQEERLTRLAGYFDRHVSRLSGELGQIGDARLMLLAALTICDEVFELKERLSDLKDIDKPLTPDTVGAAGRAVEAAAARVREITDALEDA